MVPQMELGRYLRRRGCPGGAGPDAATATPVPLPAPVLAELVLIGSRGGGRRTGRSTVSSMGCVSPPRLDGGNGRSAWHRSRAPNEQTGAFCRYRRGEVKSQLLGRARFPDRNGLRRQPAEIRCPYPADMRTAPALGRGCVSVEMSIRLTSSPPQQQHRPQQAEAGERGRGERNSARIQTPRAGHAPVSAEQTQVGHVHGPVAIEIALRPSVAGAPDTGQNTKVTDVGLPKLETMTGLEFLHLGRTTVSDAGIPSLLKLTNLKTLHVTRTKVTAKGAKQLEKSLPGCEVLSGDPDAK